MKPIRAISDVICLLAVGLSVVVVVIWAELFGDPLWKDEE